MVSDNHKIALGALSMQFFPFKLGIKKRNSLMETGGPVAQVCNPSLEPRLVTICEWDESFHPAEGVEAVSVQV